MAPDKRSGKSFAYSSLRRRRRARASVTSHRRALDLALLVLTLIVVGLAVLSLRG